MTQEARLLRSGQVARAAGVNPETLRYYERRGLLPEPERSLGGHRLYSERAVSSLRVIKVAQRLGFTLAEIAELVDGRHQRPGPQVGLQRRAGQKLAEIETRIADLQVVASALRAAIAAGCDDVVACAESDSCPIPFGASELAGQGFDTSAAVAGSFTMLVATSLSRSPSRRQ